MPAVEQMIEAQSDPDQPGATFRALDRIFGSAPGHILFTVLVHHPGLRESERFYSNLPDSYPVGGRKPVTDSPWMQQVVHAGKPYVGRTKADIEDVFFDHALIASLGCESVLNVPVRWAGQTLGTLNLLHRAGHYSDVDVPTARLLAQLAVPAFQMISRH